MTPCLTRFMYNNQPHSPARRLSRVPLYSASLIFAPVFAELLVKCSDALRSSSIIFPMKHSPKEKEKNGKRKREKEINVSIPCPCCFLDRAQKPIRLAELQAKLLPANNHGFMPRFTIRYVRLTESKLPTMSLCFISEET